MIIARRTPGFLGADLANLVNVAALRAVMDDAKALSMADLKYAKDRIMMGSECKSTVIIDESQSPCPRRYPHGWRSSCTQGHHCPSRCLSWNGCPVT